MKRLPMAIGVMALLAIFFLHVGTLAQTLPSLDSVLRGPELETTVGLTQPTMPLAFGDIDAEQLVVTDAELATVGAAPAILLLLDDPDMLIVDDDLAQCPNAQFTSIQAAVLAAMPGAKIRVCPGRYTETVFINKTLTLEAPRHQGQASQCQAPFPADPNGVAILNYPIAGSNPDIGFNVQAANVVIEGFTVQPATVPLITGGGVGIFTSPLFSGYELRHNVVQDNTTGLYANSNGAVETIIRHNCFRRNVAPGPASGNGIYSDQGLQNATIDNNFFTGHDNAAVVIDRFIGSVADIRITHNAMVDDSSIVIFNSSNVAFNNILIAYNYSLRPNGSAVFISSGTNNVEVSYNRAEGGPFNGISIRNDFGLLPGSTNLLVLKNHVSGFSQSGIRLGGSAGLNTRIQMNKSYSNTLDGIRAGANTSNFIIDRNHMKFNTEHDCHDDSTGPHNPPALVANIWTNNKGETENRPGLCKGAA